MYSDKMIHGNKPNVVTRAMSRMAASQVMSLTERSQSERKASQQPAQKVKKASSLQDGDEAEEFEEIARGFPPEAIDQLVKTLLKVKSERRGEAVSSSRKYDEDSEHARDTASTVGVKARLDFDRDEGLDDGSTWAGGASSSLRGQKKATRHDQDHGELREPDEEAPVEKI